jgi:hypothetical protein
MLARLGHRLPLFQRQVRHHIVRLPTYLPSYFTMVTLLPNSTPLIYPVTIIPADQINLCPIKIPYVMT